VAEAREAIAAGLARHEGDPELLLLLGHALHRTPGRAAEGIEAYARALDRGPLDAAALSNLAGHLGAEPAVADRAARVLVRAGAPALPVILEAASSGSGARRLRALVLARDLGAEEKLDRVKAYGALLADADCELRKAAARRLGEIGDRAALPRLREAAASRKETRGFFGQVKATPACGAAEAAEAVRKLEAARTRKAR
jgi:serine/threonine-protein kinase